jgi:hypothetical protein
MQGMGWTQLLMIEEQDCVEASDCLCAPVGNSHLRYQVDRIGGVVSMPKGFLDPRINQAGLSLAFVIASCS